MKHSAAGPRGLFSSCMLAQAVWLISALILLAASALIAASTEDPDAVIRPLALCALFLSAMAGGIAAVRFSGDGAASGALSGLLTAALVFLLSTLPLPEAGFGSVEELLLRLAVIPAAVAGSVLGHRRNGRRRKRRRR